jgi:zinc metalloprotease ZmpA
MRRVLVLGAAAAMVAAGTATAAAAPAPAAPSLSPAALAARAAASYVAARPAALHAAAGDAFVPQSVIASAEGLQYVPYRRTFAGIPVVGGDFVVVTDKAGTVLSVSVAQTATTAVSSTPAVRPATAAGTGRARAAAGGLAAAAAARPELVVYALGPPRLAWSTTVTGQVDGIASTSHVFVDAVTGTVLDSYSDTADGTGTGAIYGRVTIGTSGSGTSFSMTDAARPGIACRDFTSNRVLTGTDDVWGNGNGTAIETGCVDSMFAVEREWDMFGTWFGRSGINGSGRGFPLLVGWDNVNAQWTGSSVRIGHNQAGSWLGSMDVVGHEFGHALDSNTPGGQSANGVSEATGDIMGTSLEFFANNPNDPPDFSIGEEVNLVGNGPIRQMFDPSLVGDPACYSNSIPNAETHDAAGPLDHWYTLLAKGSAASGGQPASPTCNGSTVTGVGVQTAARIFYNAMLMKTSRMTYLRYRTATLTAAKNLTPGNCADFNAVRAAWNAISVPAQTADPTC